MALAVPLQAQHGSQHALLCSHGSSRAVAKALPPVWNPPNVDASTLVAANDGPARLAAAIVGARHGVVILRNAVQAPFGAMADLFDSVTPERAARANAAYGAGSSRLVWKDAHGEGR